MRVLYRIALVIAGCVFEGVIKDAVQTLLYWINKADALYGLIPYMVPVLLGYVYALEVSGHWSHSRLKNDAMAYMGSTVLIGYPLYVSVTLWLPGSRAESLASTIRIISTAVFAVNLAVATLVWRKAALAGMPFSLPWGTETGLRSGDKSEDSDGPTECEGVKQGDDSEHRENGDSREDEESANDESREADDPREPEQAYGDEGLCEVQDLGAAEELSAEKKPSEGDKEPGEPPVTL